MQSRFSRFLVLLPTLRVRSVTAPAQFSQPSGISGVVTEPSGAVVAKGSVRLLDTTRNQTSSTSTDSDGHYEFAQLQPGTSPGAERSK
jgi:Carboxypeptidase regulatory-like domain